MNFHKIILLVGLITFAGVQSVYAQNQKTVYIFGLSDSMRDSIVYVTNIQRIEMANVQKHTDFLLDRSDYAQQLKDYFSKRLNDRKRVNIIYVFKKEQSAYKKLSKVRHNYEKEGAIIENLESSDFAFVPISGVVDNSEELNQTKNPPVLNE